MCNTHISMFHPIFLKIICLTKSIPNAYTRVATFGVATFFVLIFFFWGCNFNYKTSMSLVTSITETIMIWSYIYCTQLHKACS